MGTCCHLSLTVALHEVQRSCLCYCYPYKVQTGCCIYVSAILHKLCCYLCIATLYEQGHIAVYLLLLHYVQCKHVAIYLLLLQCGHSPFQIFLNSYQDVQWEEYSADPSSSISFRMQDLNKHQFLCEWSTYVFMPLELVRMPQWIQYITLFVFNSPSLR